MSTRTPHDSNSGAAGEGREPSAASSSSHHRFRNSVGGSGFTRPRLDQRMNLSRSTSTQPTYNVFTGETVATGRARAPSSTAQPQPPPPPRQRPGHVRAQPSNAATAVTTASSSSVSFFPGTAASRESSKENMAPADAEEYETQRRRIEALKAEVGTLQYRVNTFEQEHEMARLQHESELRDARRKAEDDFKQRQAAEAARAAAERQVVALQAEVDSMRGEGDTRQRELERRLREALDDARVRQEQLEDVGTAAEEAGRRQEKRVGDLQAQLAAAQRALAEVEAASSVRETAVQHAQQQLAAKDEQLGRLETEVLRLKAHTGDAATMDIIRRELKDQVSHIRALEATNRDQLTELRQLRQAHKAVEIVEEEKRSLVRRLESACLVEQELAEERLQRQRLEAERRAWADYFSSDKGGDKEFDSPEALARALMEERYRTAELTERLGAVEPEMAQRDADVRLLQQQNRELTAELQRSKASANGPGAAATADKVRARLERQRTLAVKEVEYLRAQLKAFDTEDLTFHSEQFDQQKADRIRQLEDLVDQYRAETLRLHKEMADLSQQASSQDPPATTLTHKRAREEAGFSSDDTEDQRGHQLARKTRQLQDELSAARTAQRTLETELAVAREQLVAAKQAAGVRVLALRSNPTSDHEAVKQATLEALRQENTELLAHITGKASGSKFSTVPLSVLAAAQREVAAAQAETASAQKAARRLKEVWAAKSAEFKEAVESTLGWHVTFIPNGKMRVESVFYPSTSTDDEHENSIVFDGERGTMKVGGGPRSAFAQRIDDQIRFWVREKGCIPGFLAALTLEFFEGQARGGQTMTIR